MKQLLIISLILFFIPAVKAQTYPDYEKALSQYEKGELDEAYIHLKNSINDNPTHLPTKILMGEILGLSGYFEDAELVLIESIDDGADPNLVIPIMTKVLLTQRKYNQVLSISETELTPKNRAELYSAKGVAAKLLDQYEKANTFYELSLSQGIKSSSILNAAISHYLELDKLETAQRLIDEAFKLSPDNLSSIRLKALYLEKTKGLNEKIEFLSASIQQVDYTPTLHRELTTSHIQNNNFLEAKELLLVIIEKSPSEPMAQFLLSYVETQLGEDEQAKSTLDELVSELSLLEEEDDSDISFKMLSGLANYASGNIEQAIIDLSNYLIQVPTNFTIAKVLVELFQRNGQFASAVDVLNDYPEEIIADVEIVKLACTIYAQTNLNHRCQALLTETEQKFGQTVTYKKTKALYYISRNKAGDALDALIEIEEQTADVILQRAVISFRDGRLDEANRLTRTLSKENPESFQIRNLLGSILLAEGNIKEAISIYTEIINSNPNYFSATYNLAFAHFNNSNFIEAHNLLIPLVEQYPDNLRFLVLDGRTKLRLGELEQAKLRLDAANDINSNDLKLLNAFLEFYMVTADYENALYIVNDLLKQSFLDLNYLRTRAEIYLALEQLDKARQEYKIIYGIVADNPGELFQLSNEQITAQDPQGALKTIDRALELAPNDYFILRNAAGLKIGLNLLKEAAQHIRKIEKQFDDTGSLSLLRARLHAAKGESNMAFDDYVQVIKLDNQSSSALMAVYQLANQGVQPKRFESVFSELSKNANLNPFATNLLADFYMNSQQVEKAKSIYESLLPLENYFARKLFLNNLANIHLQQSNLDSALKYAKLAYDLGNPSYALLDTLGWTLTLKGDYENALGYLRQSYSMNTLDPNNRYHIAYTLHKMGRTDESVRELGYVLNEFGDFSQREAAQALLDSINSTAAAL